MCRIVLMLSRGLAPVLPKSSLARQRSHHRHAAGKSGVGQSAETILQRGWW
jgi:hypothetical protein